MEFLKKIEIKFQAILAIIGGIAAALLFFYVKGNLKFKKELEYKLEAVKKETQLAELEKDEKIKKTKIEKLKEEEKEIEEKIKFIEEREVKGEEVSLEELDDFFNSRIKNGK